MKRKSHHRPIPDFSHKRPGTVVPQDADHKTSAPPTPRAPVNAKPPATSMKSGRRGQ